MSSHAKGGGVVEERAAPAASLVGARLGGLGHTFTRSITSVGQFGRDCGDEVLGGLRPELLTGIAFTWHWSMQSPPSCDTLLKHCEHAMVCFPTDGSTTLYWFTIPFLQSTFRLRLGMLPCIWTFHWYC